MNVPRIATVALGVLSLGTTVHGQTRDDAKVRPGIVVTVEGIGGADMIGTGTAAAVKLAGLPHEVKRFNWTHGLGRFLRDLQDTQHMVKKADELAELLRDLRATNPETPLFVVARSAGTGVTLFAAGQLPAETVDRIILVSPAVSPGYDLRKALRATKAELVVFHSANDQLVLNWGTRNFGTADRFYGPSAGLHGFNEPPDLDDEGRALYRRLVQVAWSPRMLRTGYPGTHLGTNTPTFLMSEVVPWLR